MSTSARPYVDDLGGGVAALHFPEVQHVTAERSAPLVEPLTKISRTGPLAIVAVPPEALRMVEPSMVSFWVTNFTRGDIEVNAIAVVSKSIAVRVALAGLGAAMKLRQKPIVFSTFRDLETAIGWARDRRVRG